MNVQPALWLNTLAKTHGIPAVLQCLRNITREQAKNYPPDAIIHQYVTVLEEAAEKADAIHLTRALSGITTAQAAGLLDTEHAV